ncbi:hypothetical protein OG596_38045 (plasmid) [Streptomyces sp. NBC_01102]|uniref:hypothetical protein n=1 Tax=Streptomyces sp. NBC_01102 TaxID=2903749 RepID=UPI002F90E293|nr:hypothetical protein OG596_38045 [Streptomyces sp. NBC_01102]
MNGNRKPATTLSHGELPYPRGTLVLDTISERTGLLTGVLEERLKKSGNLVSRQAFMVPEGGGIEWDVPVERVRPVEPGDTA